MTGGKAAYFANIVRLYKNVWKNNVDVSTSFNNDIPFQLEKTLYEPHTAFFWHATDVQNNKNFECKVNIKIWNNGGRQTKRHLFICKIHQLFKTYFFSLKFHEVWKSQATMTSASIMVRKYSPYKKFLKQAIMSMIEKGQFNAYTMRRTKTQQECKIRRTTGDALGLSKLAALFLMLLFGCLLSFLVLLHEHFFGSKIKENFSSKLQKKEELEIKIEAIKELIPKIINQSMKQKMETMFMGIEENCLLLLQNK